MTGRVTTGWRLSSGAQEESRGHCDLGAIVEVELLKEQHGASSNKGGKQSIQRDDGRNVGEPRTEATKGVVHQCAIRHQLIDVVEGIGNHLELLVVGGDGEITLNQIVEFGIKVNGVAHHVVLEDLLSNSPESMCGLLELHDNVGNIIRDGSIEPREDSEVLLDPNGVIGSRSGAVNVLKDSKFAEHGGEEHLPLGVI